MSTRTTPGLQKQWPLHLSLLRARLGHILHMLQASLRTWVPLPPPAPVLMPIRVERRRPGAVPRRQHRGF